MSDIRKHAVEPTTRLHLRNAKDELLYADKEDGTPDLSRPMVAVLYGPGSKPYARAQTERSNRTVDKLKRKGKANTTPEEAKREQVEFLTACTVALENVTYDALEGEALARAVYSDQSLGFIADQVAAELGDWGNFLKESSRL